MQGKRLGKINSLIRKAISNAINQVLSEDWGIISINLVNVSEDLANAKVYVSSFAKNDELLEKIENNKHEINEKFIREVKLRKIPKLHFIYDRKQEEIDRIENILDKLSKEK